MQNLNIIKTVQDLKGLPISEDWHKIDKIDKYFIRRETKKSFLICDGHYYIGSIIKKKAKYILQGTLPQFDYSLHFGTLERAFDFLIEKSQTFYIQG